MQQGVKMFSTVFLTGPLYTARLWNRKGGV